MSRRTLLVVTLACVCVTQISVTRVYTQGRGQALVLPEGAGKETVQSQCSKCHALNLIGNAGGYTRQGWADLFGTMVVLGDLDIITRKSILVEQKGAPLLQRVKGGKIR